MVLNSKALFSDIKKDRISVEKILQKYLCPGADLICGMKSEENIPDYYYIKDGKKYGYELVSYEDETEYELYNVMEVEKRFDYRYEEVKNELMKNIDIVIRWNKYGIEPEDFAFEIENGKIESTEINKNRREYEKIEPLIKERVREKFEKLKAQRYRLCYKNSLVLYNFFSEYEKEKVCKTLKIEGKKHGVRFDGVYFIDVNGIYELNMGEIKETDGLNCEEYKSTVREIKDKILSRN